MQSAKCGVGIMEYGVWGMWWMVMRRGVACLMRLINNFFGSYETVSPFQA